MTFVKIISNDTADKWLEACGASAQSHLGCLILIKQKYKGTAYWLECENHESIHIAQAREWLVLFWYLLYAGHFLIRFGVNGISLKKPESVTFKEWIKNIFWKSYSEIIFEIETKLHEKDLDYIDKRKLYAYWR